MTDDGKPTLAQLPRGMTTTQSAVQRCGALLVKAALSSIPFAALVFDIGQSAIDVANARVIDRYLEELGRRVDSLSEETKKRLNGDRLHQIAGQGCLRSLLNESNERIAEALARGVAELAALPAPFHQRAECARILNAITEPNLHCLQTYYRFEHGLLTDREKEIESGFPDDQRGSARNHLGVLLVRSMPLMSWASVIETAMQLGLIEHHIDGGEIGELPEAVTVAPVTLLGERVLRLCFDDPGLPSLGGFASAPDPR